MERHSTSDRVWRRSSRLARAVVVGFVVAWSALSLVTCSARANHVAGTFATGHGSGCWYWPSHSSDTDAWRARDEQYEHCRYQANRIDAVRSETIIGQRTITGFTAPAAPGRSLADVYEMLTRGNGTKLLVEISDLVDTVGFDLAEFRNRNEAQLTDVTSGLLRDVEGTPTAYLETTNAKLDQLHDDLVALTAAVESGGEGGGPDGSDEEPVHVRYATSEPLPSAMASAAYDQHANIWFALGLATVLWFGTRFYRLVMPRA